MDKIFIIFILLAVITLLLIRRNSSGYDVNNIEASINHGASAISRCPDGYQPYDGGSCYKDQRWSQYSDCPDNGYHINLNTCRSVVSKTWTCPELFKVDPNTGYTCIIDDVAVGQARDAKAAQDAAVAKAAQDAAVARDAAAAQAAQNASDQAVRDAQAARDARDAQAAYETSVVRANQDVMNASLAARSAVNSPGYQAPPSPAASGQMVLPSSIPLRRFQVDAAVSAAARDAAKTATRAQFISSSAPLPVVPAPVASAPAPVASAPTFLSPVAYAPAPTFLSSVASAPLPVVPAPTFLSPVASAPAPAFLSPVASEPLPVATASRPVATASRPVAHSRQRPKVNKA